MLETCSALLDGIGRTTKILKRTTYTILKRKMPLTAIFCERDMFRLRIMNRGRSWMTKSIAMLVLAPLMK